MRISPLILAVSAGLSGCSSGGPTLSPTKGKVFVNKVPAAGALVVFHPKGDKSVDALRPSAIVGDDGSFTLGCGAVGAGAPPGEYDVTVIWEAKPAGSAAALGGMSGKDGEAKNVPDKLGGRYAAPGKGGLTATVQSKETELSPFELK